MANRNTALVTDLKQASGNIESYLMEKQDLIAQVVGKRLNSERMIHLALSCGRRSPDLFKCTPASWVTALLDAGFFGIEPNPQLGHAYLIPFRNRKKKGDPLEVQFMIGYKGKILLIERGGLASNINPVVVYDCDEFELQLEREWEGKAPFIHRPKLERPKEAKLDLVYCTGVLASGQRKFAWLPKTGNRGIDYYRAKSRASSSGPWVTDYEAMALKTGVHRFSDSMAIPPSSQVALANKYERSFEEGAPIHAFRFDEKRDVIDAELAEEGQRDDGPPPDGDQGNLFD